MWNKNYNYYLLIKYYIYFTVKYYIIIFFLVFIE